MTFDHPGRVPAESCPICGQKCVSWNVSLQRKALKQHMIRVHHLTRKGVGVLL